MTSYLRALHGFAIQIVIKEYRERRLLQVAGRKPPSRKGDTGRRCNDGGRVRLAGYRSELRHCAANQATVAQVMFINQYHLPDRDKQRPIIFLANRFPTAYVAALDKLVHRDWYVACFAKTGNNHSMWSTYANGHRGVV